MTHKHWVCSATLGLLAFTTLVGVAQPQPIPSTEPANKSKTTSRKLLYPANLRDVSPALKPHVERLLAVDQKPIEPNDAKASGVYLRIISRQYAFENGKPKTGGWIGTRPFVFLTIPETAYGRDLLGTLAAIGYDLEDILETEKGAEKVAVVFTYPDKVKASDVKDGALPEDWDQRVYPATWDNIFTLADRMTTDKERWVALRPDGDGFLPAKFQLRSDREVSFIRGFPDEGKRRVKMTDYAALREIGGADWAYRQLIERLFGASEHYRGDGRTKLTLAGKRKPRAGFLEFLGPNTELKDLPVLAIVGLGTLRVEE
ncbi:MAG: hypothetical protein K8U57_13115 [Planctomycetes bacterium]|nr:hypothetical protein [Planctomycetota bacterium]